MTLEPMDAFFAARVDTYDTHMLQNVEGCREGYPLMAALLPSSCRTLLDLGCGTGLELDEILARFPALEVTGIDLSSAMLARLHQKHPDKALTTVCGDYFAVPFGTDCFDCAVSFETLHHFAKEKKLGLYQKLCTALRPRGIYVECDYMTQTEAQEDYFFAKAAQLRREQAIPDDAYVHYDTPCSIENQMRLLREAGFARVEKVFEMGGTVMLVAQK